MLDKFEGNNEQVLLYAQSALSQKEGKPNGRVGSSDRLAEKIIILELKWLITDKPFDEQVFL